MKKRKTWTLAALEREKAKLGRKTGMAESARGALVALRGAPER